MTPYVKATDDPRRSWHLLRAWSEHEPWAAIMLCGKRFTKPLVHAGVPAQRTCESCFRVRASRADRPL